MIGRAESRSVSTEPFDHEKTRHRTRQHGARRALLSGACRGNCPIASVSMQTEVRLGIRARPGSARDFTRTGDLRRIRRNDPLPGAPYSVLARSNPLPAPQYSPWQGERGFLTPLLAKEGPRRGGVVLLVPRRGGVVISCSDPLGRFTIVTPGFRANLATTRVPGSIRRDRRDARMTSMPCAATPLC